MLFTYSNLQQVLFTRITNEQKSFKSVVNIMYLCLQKKNCIKIS